MLETRNVNSVLYQKLQPSVPPFVFLPGGGLNFLIHFYVRNITAVKTVKTVKSEVGIK